MHRSKLMAALFDVPNEVYEREVGFWAAAVGEEPVIDPDDPDYAGFGQVLPGFEVLVQRIGEGASRIHLDIETDDVQAEVSRLETLGAERVDQINSWWVLRDPAGLLFCVVPVQTGDQFSAHAKRWE